MRKGIVLALIAAVGFAFSSYARAAEVLWSVTNNTDITAVANDASGTETATSEWFPLIKTVFSDERGGVARLMVPDFLRFNITMAPTALPGTKDDSVNVVISFQTSNDKIITSQSTIELVRLREAQASSVNKDYEVNFPIHYLTETVPLTEWGRLVFRTMAVTTDGAEGDSITIDKITYRALTRSR